MTIKYQNIFLLFLVVSVLQSCLKEPEYPNEPALTYIGSTETNLEPDGGTVFTVSFTDGDGDLGNVGISNPSCSGSSIYLFDYTTPDSSCFLDSYYTAYLIDSRDSSYRSVFVPDLKPEGDAKSISGEIDFTYDVPFCKCVSLVLTR